MSHKRNKLAATLEREIFDLWTRLNVVEERVEISVDPDDMIIAKGWYRTSPMANCFRWEAPIRVNGKPLGLVASMDTLTECSRFGVILAKLSRSGGWLHMEATAKNGSQPQNGGKR